MSRVLRLAFTQDQLEALAAGQVLVFDLADLQIQLTADAAAVAAFQEHVFTALLTNLNPSNPLPH